MDGSLGKGDDLRGSVGITCQNWIFDASLPLASLGSVSACWAFKSHSKHGHSNVFIYHIYKTVRPPLPQVASVTYRGSPELKEKRQKRSTKFRDPPIFRSIDDRSPRPFAFGLYVRSIITYASSQTWSCWVIRRSSFAKLGSLVPNILWSACKDIKPRPVLRRKKP